MSDRTSKKHKSNKSSGREVRELLNDHYLQAQKQTHILFWFSLIFYALALIVELGLSFYAITQTQDTMELRLALSLSINTLAVFIYKKAKATQRRAFELHSRALLCDLVMSISDDDARNTALSKLVQDLAHAQSSMENRRLFGRKPLLDNLVTKAARNYQTS